MNDNNGDNTNNVTPYRSSGNLYTAIGNPSINVNDTMNVNIQNMATNSPPVNNTQNYNVGSQTQNINQQVNTPIVNQNNNPIHNNVSLNTTITNTSNNSVSGNVSKPATEQKDSFVKKTYVTADNKPKKKTISLNLGPEFKTALLIIVILLVFVFLLPMISDMFNGY